MPVTTIALAWPLSSGATCLQKCSTTICTRWAMLIEQAQSNSKEQFANSPDLAKEMLNAIMDALAAHSTMSKQALESPKVRGEMQDVLLGPGQLYEALRARRASSPDQRV